MRQALDGIFAAKIHEPFCLNLLGKLGLTPKKLHEARIICGLGFHLPARCASCQNRGQRADRLNGATTIQPTWIAQVSLQIEAGDLTATVRKKPVAASPALQNLVDMVRPFSTSGKVLVMAHMERCAREAFCPF